MMSWESWLGDRLETVRVVTTERGMRANGYVIQAGEAPYGASYQFLVDVAGRTRRLAVQSDSVEGERHLALTRTPGGPWVVESTAGSRPLFALNGAEDLQLDSSAFTPALAIRRLGIPERQRHRPHSLRVGCISMPTLEVRAVEYEYTFGDGDKATLVGPEGHLDLTIDERGFVVLIPGHSRRLS